MNNFWKQLNKPFFILAPMEDVTDIVFRKVVAKAAAPDVFFTEFTNSASYAHSEGIKSLRGRLKYDENERPIVAHIWGNNPNHFKEMSIGLAKMGFDGIDINMGCPVDNVVKQYSGSGLIKKPELAAELIAAAKSGGLPVSVKTRIGYSKLVEYKEWISHLLKQDIVNLSIHLRTRSEMSDVPAHFELIPDIMKLRDEIAPNTLITINGDINNYHHGMELYNKYGVDGIMIGRGIFRDPFAFSKNNLKRSKEDLLNLFRYHLDTYDKYVLEEPRLAKKLNRFYKIYIKDFKGAKHLRVALVNSDGTDEARNLIKEFETNKQID